MNKIQDENPESSFPPKLFSSSPALYLQTSPPGNIIWRILVNTFINIYLKLIYALEKKLMTPKFIPANLTNIPWKEDVDHHLKIFEKIEPKKYRSQHNSIALNPIRDDGILSCTVNTHIKIRCWDISHMDISLLEYFIDRAIHRQTFHR